SRDWSTDVSSSDLQHGVGGGGARPLHRRGAGRLRPRHALRRLPRLPVRHRRRRARGRGPELLRHRLLAAGLHRPPPLPRHRALRRPRLGRRPRGERRGHPRDVLPVTTALLISALFGLLTGTLHGLHDSMWLDQTLARRGHDVDGPIEDLGRLLWRRPALALARRVCVVGALPLGLWLPPGLGLGGVAAALVTCGACEGALHHVSHNAWQGRSIWYNLLDYDA